LAAEKRRTVELDAKIERMLATVADREEKLDRREKELARLRDQIKAITGTENEASARLVELQGDRVRLESEVADLTLQLSNLLNGAQGRDVEKAIAKLNEERDRLEGRLTALARENKKLKAELTAFERAKSEDWSDERRASALLREQINDLAAEVISMTAALEGSDSPIRKALAAAPGIDAARAESAAPASAADPRDKITSLADRVKALQKAASAG
jgi:chromosome segregation ATPase